MSVFTPDLMLHDVTRIDKTLLDAHGIRGLILDVDNTLADHGSQHLRQSVRDWLSKMDAAGIKMIVASNNTKERVEPFAQKLGLDYVSFSCKPLSSGLVRAQKKLGLEASEIAVVGDQIYTDIVGGNRRGMFTILVTPFLVEEQPFLRFKRSLETIHIRAYQRRRAAEHAQSSKAHGCRP